MRALQKANTPDVLIECGPAWTDEYIAAEPADRPSKERWGHRRIRERLSEETGGRCAYCEGRVADVAYEHVEHIMPKSLFPELAHDWPNLTLACPRCNQGKGAYHEAGREVLNPYVDHPQAHLLFVANLVFPVYGSERGEISVRRLKLDRLDLSNSRMERLYAVNHMVARWAQAQEPLRGLLADSIRLESSTGEFTASVEAFLRHVGFPLDAAAGAA